MSKKYKMKTGETIEKFGKTINTHIKKRIEYKKGDVLGKSGITFLEEIEPDTRLKNKKDTKLINFRKALFLCHCGKPFECRIDRIKSNYTKSCGCLRGSNGKIRL